MSNQLEKVKELIELRAQARLGGGAKAIENNTIKVSTQPANVFPCSLTKAALKKWTCSYSIVAQTSEWTRSIIWETAS